MFIKRTLEAKILELGNYFPVVAVMGPRQSGKTTLLKNIYEDLTYVSLEDPDNREFAETDPRSFLDQYHDGVIIDEIQRVPQLFSYIQTLVDFNHGLRFVLSGSQNFLLAEKISQSLAGRVGIVHLLPLSYRELKEENFSFKDAESLIFQGFYPRIYDKQIPTNIYFSSYLQTYVERDVRLIKNISNLSAFNRFIKLCAGRVGQLLNFSALANDAGIAVNTAKEWISVLESSYIIFLLQPHYRNFRKRLTKMPKLYFYDTGLVSYLLGIDSEESLKHHFAVGSLFENFVILEISKQYYNKGIRPPVYFWRDHLGNEIDLIIERGDKLDAIEIKAGKTPSISYFEGLNYWNKLAGTFSENRYVVYGGEKMQQREAGYLLPWFKIPEIV